MTNLTADITTAEENAALDAAVRSIRAALKRFEEGRADRCCYAPGAMLSVNALEAHWRVSVTGRPVAHGATLEGALRDLAGQTDADRLRLRAAELRHAAARMEEEARAADAAAGGREVQPACGLVQCGSNAADAAGSKSGAEPGTGGAA